MVKKHVIFFLALFVLVFPPRAHAYLDPGTGSYALQILAAVFFGGIFFIKTWWNHIMNFFSRLFGGKGRKSEKESSKKD